MKKTIDELDENDNEQLGPIARAFRLVSALVEADEPLNGKQMTDLLALPTSTTHRLLQILGNIGIVQRRRDGPGYVPGPELFRIAFAVMRKSDVISIARPFIQQVVDALDATTIFWMYFDSARTLIPSVVITSRQQLDFKEITFVPRGLAWGNVGRVILAYLPDELVKEVVATAGKSPTGLAMEPLRKLKAELTEIRARGYAFSAGHTVREAVGFSAPVFDYRNEIVGGIGCTMPAIRYLPTLHDHCAAVVSDRAKALSAALGYQEAWPKLMASGKLG